MEFVHSGVNQNVITSWKSKTHSPISFFTCKFRRGFKWLQAIDVIIYENYNLKLFRFDKGGNRIITFDVTCEKAKSI